MMLLLLLLFTPVESTVYSVYPGTHSLLNYKILHSSSSPGPTFVTSSEHGMFLFSISSSSVAVASPRSLPPDPFSPYIVLSGTQKGLAGDPGQTPFHFATYTHTHTQRRYIAMCAECVCPTPPPLKRSLYPCQQWSRIRKSNRNRLMYQLAVAAWHGTNYCLHEKYTLAGSQIY